jgi:hypothetical protein
VAASVTFLLASMFVTAPLIVLVHELGHARAVWRVAARPSVVLVGGGPVLFEHRFATMHVRVRALARGGGACGYDARGLTVEQERAITMAGPWATVGLGLLCAMLAALVNDPHSLLYWIPAGGFADSLINSAWNLIPRRLADGRATDGYKLAELRNLDPGLVRRPAS